MPLTLNAVVARVNRRLEREHGTVLRRTPECERHRMGDFHELDVSRNLVVGYDRDPEALARELGVLRPGNVIVD
jgi:hypothetical protein